MNVSKTNYNEILYEIKKLRQELNLMEFHKSRKHFFVKLRNTDKYNFVCNN